MPDSELMVAAQRGHLQDPKLRIAQARRMLADPKAQGFIQNFTTQWLQLNQMEEMPPDESRFRDYYHEDLATAMKTETFTYVDHLFQQNLPIKNLVDSDFSFFNAALAKHYGVKGVTGELFRKVRLPRSANRGGIITHASLLTATSNGVDTSPVTRGVRILEAILGTPPSPPPPDVEPLEPDIRGAKTIRDQLKRHREVETCNECHRNIDPYGFALEHFDPVGRWRKTYSGKRTIDSSGRTPDGHDFTGIAQLQGILASRDEQIARGFAEKLFSYALGRTLTFRERPAIDRIVARVKPNDFRMQDLLLAVIADEEFHRR
jgi:hypothetical protein